VAGASRALRALSSAPARKNHLPLYLHVGNWGYYEFQFSRTSLIKRYASGLIYVMVPINPINWKILAPVLVSVLAQMMLAGHLETSKRIKTATPGCLLSGGKQK
jgi:hypothetical protein